MASIEEKIEDIAKKQLDNIHVKYFTKTESINSEIEILLPVNQINEIDYNFMETYIKAIEKKVIQKVIAWKDSEMKTLKASS